MPLTCTFYFTLYPLDHTKTDKQKKNNTVKFNKHQQFNHGEDFLQYKNAICQASVYFTLNTWEVVFSPQSTRKYFVNWGIFLMRLKSGSPAILQWWLIMLARIGFACMSKFSVPELSFLYRLSWLEWYKPLKFFLARLCLQSGVLLLLLTSSASRIT